MKDNKTNRSEPITLKDIAMEAKVSVTAVSMALSNRTTSRVSETTKKHILKIAERLNYKPNYIARSLVSKKTHSIGLVVTTLLNPFYAEIAHDVINRATALGYTVSICSAREGLEQELACVEEFVNRGVDGLILCSVLRDDPVVFELSERGIPFVLAMRNVKESPEVPPIDYIGIDNVRGGYMAVEHLIRLGHSRVALICGPEETSTGYDRKKGALAAFEAYNIFADPKLILTGKFVRKSGQQLAKKLLKLKERPTAIFAANDHMAIGALEALNEEGLSVPKDMALIGFDNIEVTGLPGIDLTTVSQKKETMGRLAVDHLVSDIKGESKHVIQKTILSPILVVRNSCGFKKRENKYEIMEKKLGFIPN